MILSIKQHQQRHQYPKRDLIHLIQIIVLLIPSSLIATVSSFLYPNHLANKSFVVKKYKNTKSMSTVISSSSLEDDAKDFNDIVSQSVDLSNSYVRNDILTVTRSARDIDNNKKRQFMYQIPLLHPNIKLSPIEISSTDIINRIPSPSGNKLAIIRSININNEQLQQKQHWLEIWIDNGMKLQQRIELPTTINTDWNLFGSIEWNTHEDSIVYVGMKNDKDVSYSTFFERQKDDPSNNNKVIIGDKYAFGKGIKDDYGELYDIDNSYPTLYLIRLLENKVYEITNVPKNASLGQVQFAPDGKHIIYTAWEYTIGSRKLGITYCQQRPCKLYLSSITHVDDAKDEPICLTPNFEISFSPRITKDKIVFLSSTNGFDTHFGCLELHSMNFHNTNNDNDELPSCSIVDISSAQVLIHKVESIDVADKINNSEFPGLYMINIPKECFSSNYKYLYLNTIYKCMNRIIKVNLNDNKYELLFDKDDDELYESHTLLCTTPSSSNSNGLVCTCSRPNKPPMIKYVNDIDDASTTTTKLDITHPIAISSFSPLTNNNMILDNLIEYKVYSTPVPSILLLPKQSSTSSSSIPLIVVPHGGPHSALTTNFLPSYSYLCASGQYAILLINFRGSIGYGSKYLNDLPGNIGKYDVDDVVTATNYIINEYKDLIDSNRIGICGGSHGGFLAAHCIGQYPNIYKVAALRNPVTDIPSMVASTDIPDWCFVESLGVNTYDINNSNTTFQPTKEQLCTMYDQSPIAHIDHVRAPTILALGASDKRVPMRCQGLEYYYRLKSKGVECKCLIYENDSHPLSSPVTESDHWVNVKRWFDHYL